MNSLMGIYTRQGPPTTFDNMMDILLAVAIAATVHDIIKNKNEK